MVEVFKTSVSGEAHAGEVIHHLQRHLPSAKINIDTEDCDHVLRIEDQMVSCTYVIQLMTDAGCSCELLT